MSVVSDMSHGYVLAHLRIAMQSVERNAKDFPPYTANRINDLMKDIERNKECPSAQDV